MKRLVPLLLLTLLPTANAGAQATGQISGIVTDQVESPLSTAQISVGTTGRGALSGATGQFSVTGVPAGIHQVRVSRLGYGAVTKSVTVTAGETARVDFQLLVAAIELDAVVAVGYGTQRKRDLTGAVSSVQARELQQSSSPSVAEALKGRVPGLDVQTTSFRPGDQPRIRIRGVRSMRAGNDPLLVVDGVAIAGGIGDINPSSIESIEVLKDASATAVYGSRGANGVILITTNQGQPGKVRVTYDGSYGIESARNLVPVFNGPEFAEYKREAYRTAGKYKCDGQTVCEAGDRDLFSAVEYDGIQSGASYDYVDLILRRGAIQNHQLGISGGNENTRFAIGANFLDENGIALGMGFVRRGASINVKHDEGRFNAGFSANLTNSLQNLSRGDGVINGAMRINPIGNPYFEDGTPNPTPTTDAQMWNPLNDAENWKRDNLRTRAFGNASLGYELLDGIVLQTIFGADLGFEREGEFRGAWTQPNRGSSNDAWVNREQTFNYVSTTALQVNRQLSDAHRVNATLLFEVQNEQWDRSRVDVLNLPYEHQLYFNPGTAGKVRGVSGDYREWLLQSGMARVNYTLLDRYYLTLTGRQDCSSRLAPGNKCAFFPSAAAKWRLSDEGFMQNQSLFNELSLRASFGRTGNTAIDPYQTQGGLSRTTYSFDGRGAFGFQPGSLANPALVWEKTDQYDVGLEFGLLGNRITGSADLFVANTFDLLLLRQLPPTSGFGSILENIGQTRNKGVELAISTVNLDRGNFRWSTDLSWTSIRNEIVSLYGGEEDDVGNNWFIGEPINVFYQYAFDGIWQLDQAAEAASFGQKPGQIRVKDLNGDGKIDSGDRSIIGNHNNFPSWTGSVANRFEMGGFDLSALITARMGYNVNSNIYPGPLAGRYNNVKIDYWTPDRPSNQFPRPNVDQEFPIYGQSVRLMDGSHVRVRNVTLGYQLPSSVTGRLGQSSSLRVYAQAQDPFVFTDFKGFDPEGGENEGVPAYRTLMIGASVGF